MSKLRLAVPHTALVTAGSVTTELNMLQILSDHQIAARQMDEGKTDLIPETFHHQVCAICFIPVIVLGAVDLSGII